MQESDSMPPEEVSVSKSSLEKSPLDKPLEKLTEYDIAQVTREDCRRYLKEKGMRRPSWNKSQAIQQVIMLKALLEAPADGGNGFRKRFRISRSNKFQGNTAVRQNFTEGTYGDAENRMLTEDTSRYSRKDMDKFDLSCGVSGRYTSGYDGSALPRTVVSTNMPAGQMTIFYSGEVNVYDDVPADKAWTLMHIAANSLHFRQEQPVDTAILIQPSSILSKVVGTKAYPDSKFVCLPSQETVKTSDNPRVHREESTILCEDNPVEGPSNRKACVQRYLEKRKDSQGLRSNERKEFPRTTKRCCSVDNDFVKNAYASSEVNN